MFHAALRTSLATVAISVVAMTWAHAASPTQTATTAKGPALADARGMTLYTFDKDSAGKSNCNGVCAANWPALKAGSDDQPTDAYTVVVRDDGSKQWAYKAKPLYSFVNDKKPGDVNGDGFLNNTWHIAKP